MEYAVYLAQQLPVNAVTGSITAGGIIGLLSLIVTAFLRGWVVTASQYAEVQRQRDEFKEIAFQLSRISQGSIRMADERRPNAGYTR